MSSAADFRNVSRNSSARILDKQDSVKTHLQNISL